MEEIKIYEPYEWEELIKSEFDNQLVKIKGIPGFSKYNLELSEMIGCFFFNKSLIQYSFKMNHSPKKIESLVCTLETCFRQNIPLIFEGNYTHKINNLEAPIKELEIKSISHPEDKSIFFNLSHKV